MLKMMNTFIKYDKDFEYGADLPEFLLKSVIKHFFLDTLMYMQCLFAAVIEENGRTAKGSYWKSSRR